MNKTIVASALLMLSSSMYAQDPIPASSVGSGATPPTAPSTNTPATTPTTTEPATNAPVTTTPSTNSNPATAPMPSTPSAPTSSTTPTTAPVSANQVTPAAPVVPATMDCHYRIPAATTVTPEIVSTWTEKATAQAFDYNSENIDIKLQELKACFTDQGWKGYNDAMSQSGNLNAIKAQKLTVSSQIDGQSTISSIKDNQWKVSIPLQVVYQNDKEKLTQQLNIDVLVTRKVSGDLGIAQIIAAPRGNAPKS